MHDKKDTCRAVHDADVSNKPCMCVTLMPVQLRELKLHEPKVG